MSNQNETPLSSLELFLSDKKNDAIELNIIKKYVQKLLKHQISVPPHFSFKNSLSTPELLESFASFIRISHKLQKYAPDGFKMPSNKAGIELFISLHIPDDQAQQSQHLSELSEMFCFQYFCLEMEKHKTSLGELSYSFQTNQDCDIYCLDFECTKLDIIFDIYQESFNQSLNIECKYLSYAFFNELIVKNVFDPAKEELKDLCLELNRSFALMFSHCDPYVNYSQSKNSPNHKMMEAFSTLSVHSLKLVPYIPDALNSVASFICNKKQKQFALFKENGKNVLFMSLMDFTTKHNFFQTPLHSYFTSDSVSNIVISSENHELNIDRLIINYRYENVYFKQFALIAKGVNSQGLATYEYQLQPDESIADYLLIFR